MGKLTKEQAATLAELERLRDAQDDGGDVEVYVRDERGRETRLTGAHAQRWLTNLFGEEAPAPKKATPKKATKAAPAAADDDEDQGDEEEETEEVDPPAARKHWLFGTPAATG